MRILVTGAGGYIGRHLVSRLRDENHEILPVYHIGSDWGNASSPWIKSWIETDLTNAPTMSFFAECVNQEMKDRSIDTVIHLAGRVDINLQPNPKSTHLPPIPGPCDTGALYRDNVLATANVLQYCLEAKVKHLIFASTQAVYGMPEFEGRIFTEDSQPRPLEHYAASKVSAEELLRIGAGHGLNVTVLRIPGIFGGDRKSGTVWRMCKQAIQHYEIQQTIDFPLPFDCLHIEDAVDAFAKTTAWGGTGYQVMNIATGMPNDLTQLALDIAELVTADPVEGTHRALLAMHSEKAALCFGWKAKPRQERYNQIVEDVYREVGLK